MIYLYHFVPEGMQGTVLYPLNQLKATLSEVFEREASKYKGREAVQDTIIPGLGTWNDVIHLSPIEPKKVIAAMKACGAPADFAWQAFRIDAGALDQSKLVIMVTHKDGEQYRKEFLPFTQANYLRHNEIPEITRQHYREARAKGEQPLTFAGAPHALYKGIIDTKDLEIIDYG